MVKIGFVDRDPRILPEMSAKVAFLSQEVPADQRSARTVVQPGSIVDRNGRSVVYVIRDNRVSAVEIQTAGRIGEMIEVVKGVAPGDRIVLKPTDKLRDGGPVSLSAK